MGKKDLKVKIITAKNNPHQKKASARNWSVRLKKLCSTQPNKLKTMQTVKMTIQITRAATQTKTTKKKVRKKIAKKTCKTKLPLNKKHKKVAMISNSQV